MLAELTLDSFLKPDILWIIIGLVLIFLELIIPGLLVIFFGLGALIVGVACRIWDISINSQLVIFIITSVSLLLLLRGWLKTIFTGFTPTSQTGETNLTDNIGKKAVVITRIEPNLTGKVELHGSNWEAEADVIIEAGATVEIVSQNNLTFTVRPL